MYLGAPRSAPSSIKSKSKTKFKEAITTTNKLNPILNKELLLILKIGKAEPNILATNPITYTISIPPVAAATPSLKFSVGFISRDL